MRPLVYGTAWKEDRTGPLVRAALAAGFRAFDTANQRKHYHEAAVGAALRASSIPRDELFVQTKFTFVRGQDHRLPYDPKAPIAQQVERSIASSLEHLGVERLDSYLLHGPSTARGLTDADWEAWRAMEDAQRAGRARRLGVSNVTHEQLAVLHAGATVKPSIVQNRTLVYPRADEATRAFCRDHDIIYQGFSLLTAAPPLLSAPPIHAIAARTGLASGAIALRAWVDQGVVALTGTSDPAHMADDLAAVDVELTPEESAGLARLFV